MFVTRKLETSFLLVVYALLRCSDCFSQHIVQDPVIVTTSGGLRGTWLTSAAGRQYAAFKGIPYARPPLGQLRFEPPQEAEPWRGIRDARKHGRQCPQLLWILDTLVGDEDCLYLNAYVPSPRVPADQTADYSTADTTGLLPMIFFIHGGSWNLGSGDMDDYLYGPDLFMDEDVVLVTINYRLGALGFLSLDYSTIPGNMGLKDQAMALSWAWRNAQVLGADRNRIVMVGQSSGAASAQYHLLNVHSRQMLFGAISQSGSVLTPWAWTAPRKQSKRTRKLAVQLNCTLAEPEATIRCLKQADPYEIVKHESLSSDRLLTQFPIGITFSPTAEPRGTLGAFLQQCPRSLLADVDSMPRDKPFITGYNTAEGKFFVDTIEAIVNPAARRAIFRTLDTFQRRRNSSLRRAMGKNLRDTSLASPLVRLFGNYEFDTPILRGSQLHASAGANVYLYYFPFVGRNNFMRLFRDSAESTHFDELTYQFRGRGIFSGLPILKEPSPEATVSKSMLRMWADFARTGNPTPGSNGTWWPTVARQKLLVIGERLTLRDIPTKLFGNLLVDAQCIL